MTETAFADISDAGNREPETGNGERYFLCGEMEFVDRQVSIQTDLPCLISCRLPGLLEALGIDSVLDEPQPHIPLADAKEPCGARGVAASRL
jgi:hypothetical protein